MTVSLSPLGGVAAQFLDNNGIILSGGKIYTYAAGTTTPQATYTSSTGATPHANPIVLDSAGRVPGGEIWLTDGLSYKFTVETSTSILLGTYDNVRVGAAASAISLVPSGYTTATNVQTAFDNLGSSAGTSKVGFIAADAGAVARTAQSKLRDIYSVKDFGPCGNGSASEDTAAFQAWIAAINAAARPVAGFIPAGNYSLASATLTGTPLTLTAAATIYGEGASVITMTGTSVVKAMFHVVNVGATFSDLQMVGNNQGTSFTNGAAIFFEQTNASVTDVNNCRVRNCAFENFKTPWCVSFISSAPANKISGYEVTNCQFISKSGNSIAPANIAQVAVFVAAYGVEGTGGNVESGLIADNYMEAQYIKSGVLLFHQVRKTIVRNNIVISAGLTGASDDSGAYAIYAYSDDGEATDNQIVDNIIINARSIGIYVRGQNERMSILGNTISVVTDVLNASLPKGGICILGATDFTCSNNTVTLANADGFYFIPSASQTTKRALFQNNSAQSCGTVSGSIGFGAGLRLVGANAIAPNVDVRGFMASECKNGIFVSLFDSGGFVDLVVTGVNILSAVSASYGIRIFTNETLYNLPRPLIGGTSKIKAVITGIDAAGVSGKGIITGVDIVGPFTSRAINIDNSTFAIGDGVTIRGQTFASGGFALGTAGQQGGIADSLRFIDCDDTALVFISGTDGGVNTPVFAATKNEFVKLILPVRTAAAAPIVGAFYTVRGWRLVDTGWVECRELCA
jgi:hypothetical protein